MAFSFLETLCILEWHYSKSSLCHVKCILSKLDLISYSSEWYKVLVVIYIYLYIWKFTIFAICCILVVNTDIYMFWKIKMNLFFICINLILIKNYKFPPVHTMCFICSTLDIVKIVCHFDWLSEMTVKMCNSLWSSIYNCWWSILNEIQCVSKAYSCMQEFEYSKLE